MKLKLEVDQRDVPSPLLRVDLFQAADRPDRFEATFLDDLEAGPGAAGEGAGAARWRAGAHVTAAVAGERVFAGTIARVASAFNAARGRTLTLVAYADYHRLRGLVPPERWRQATDSEAAEWVASALELVAAVERTDRVHAFLDFEGDPLQFLRRRARACGFQLAVTAGRLYFARSLPSLGDPLLLAAGRDLIGIETAETSTGRGGFLDARGDPRWRPLVSFEVKGLDGRAGRRYRSVRTFHTLDRDGYRTRVEFVEGDLDYALLRGGQGGGESLDLKE